MHSDKPVPGVEDCEAPAGANKPTRLPLTDGELLGWHHSDRMYKERRVVRPPDPLTPAEEQRLAVLLQERQDKAEANKKHWDWECGGALRGMAGWQAGQGITVHIRQKNPAPLSPMQIQQLRNGLHDLLRSHAMEFEDWHPAGPGTPL